MKNKYSLVRWFTGSRFSINEEYISPNEFKETYELARRTRAAVRGFINYLKKYEERKLTNHDPWTVNREPNNLSTLIWQLIDSFAYVL